MIYELNDRTNRDAGGKKAQVQQKIMHTETEKEIQMSSDTYSLVGNQVYSLSSVSSSFPADRHDLEQIRCV